MSAAPHPLPRTVAALAAGRLCLGFLGGSITDSKTRARWPENVIAWLADAHPRARIVVENAAIGATGSDLAAFRAARDILPHGCDLVFVEYSVNDYDTDPQQRHRSREGLLRTLLGAGCEVVIVHTYRREMQEHYDAGRLPPSVACFERLAEHYGIGTVNVGLHVVNLVARGLVRRDAWLPDGLHPEHAGSALYADAIIAHLRDALAGEAGAPPPMPVPLDPLAWERTRLLSWNEIEWSSPWTLRRWGDSGWIDQVLHTDAPGARIRARFTGRTLVAAFDFGSTSSEIRWRIDGGEWNVTRRERPAWAGARGWFRPTVLAQELSSGSHSVELETLLSIDPVANGCTTDLAWLGVVE